jgi:hypothetical protein
MVFLSRVEISVKIDISTLGDEQITVCVCVCVCVWKRRNSFTQQLTVIIIPAELSLLFQTERSRRYGF